MALKGILTCDFCEGDAIAKRVCIFCEKDICHSHDNTTDFHDFSTIEYRMLSWWMRERSEKMGMHIWGVCPGCQGSKHDYYVMDPVLVDLISDDVSEWVDKQRNKKS